MKNAVFWDATPCGSCKNRRFREMLLVTANVVTNSLILYTLMLEATFLSDTSVLTRATRRRIQVDGILMLWVDCLRNVSLQTFWN
jgi:hypothetical protein